jgi:hypothetical protein
MKMVEDKIEIEELKPANRIIDILNCQKTGDRDVLLKATNSGIEDVNILIKHSISLKEVSDFVEAVSDNCFEDGEYKPVYKNMYIARALIIYFTDLAMPEDFDDVYKVINETSLIDLIKMYMSETQLYDILQAIDATIEFKKQQILKNSEFENMMVDLGGLVSLGIEKLSQLDLSKMDFSKVNGLVDNIVGQIEAVKE